MEFLIPIVLGVVTPFACLIWCMVRVRRFGPVANTVYGLVEELNHLQARLSSLERKFAERAKATDNTAAQPAIAEPVSCELTTHMVKSQPVAVEKQAMAEPNAEPLDMPAVQTKVAEIPQRQSTVGQENVQQPRPASAAPVVPPSVATPAQTPAKRSISLEEKLGQNWLNKLGIVTLITGIALLLGYQARNLGPAGKSVLGFLLSLGILLAGVVLERRERYRIFARAAIGGGGALLYFVTFAVYHVPAMQVLHTQLLDLVLMLSVAAGMVMHSLRYRSQAVTGLAFLLGFLTVSISHITISSLVASAILAAGLVLVAFRERWFAMAFGGLAVVYLNHFMWLQRVLPNGGHAGHPFPALVPSAALLLFDWLLFRAFYIFRCPATRQDSAWSTALALLNSAGLLTLLKYQSTHPEWAFSGLLALGFAELAMAFVARRRHHSAFVLLTCVASLLLLAAVPFHFAGTSWSLLWLLQAELMLIAGQALRETVFRRLGVLSIFAAVINLFLHGVAQVFVLRQSAPDISHHVVLALAVGCAAVMAWWNGEWMQRRQPAAVQAGFDRVAFCGLSYAGALCAAVALWLVLPGAWTVTVWLVLATLLAFAADRLGSIDLAQQADLLSLAAMVRLAIMNFAHWKQFAHSPRTVILVICCALLYAQSRRKQPSYFFLQSAIEQQYTWCGAASLSCLAWYALQPAAVSVVWCLQGVLLVELGLATRKSFLRQQGFVVLAASFTRLFFINVALASAPRLYTMLPLAAIFAYVYQRLYASDERNRIDRVAAPANAWFGLATIAALLYFSLRPEWVAIGGAALAVAAIVLAAATRRPLLTAQAIALSLVTAVRTLSFNVLSAEPIGVHFVESRIFTVSVTCALLLAVLPLAFLLHRQHRDQIAGSSLWTRLLRHPERVFFFSPLVVLFALVPMQLCAGMITVGWSALGVVTFLFALAVRERSFRLTGLALLLVGVGKIVTVDVWNASPMDRYVTLIVMGAALLLVSFLYSRYREMIRELL